MMSRTFRATGLAGVIQGDCSEESTETESTASQGGQEDEEDSATETGEQQPCGRRTNEKVGCRRSKKISKEQSNMSAASPGLSKTEPEN